MKKSTGTAEASVGTTPETVAAPPETVAAPPETVAAPVETAAVPETGKKRSRSNEFWCYIGPNLTHFIQTGTIFRGTREEALEAAKDAIEKYPLVKSLIVSGENLQTARIDVKKPGTAMHKLYSKVAAVQPE